MFLIGTFKFIRVRKIGKSTEIERSFDEKNYYEIDDGLLMRKNLKNEVSIVMQRAVNIKGTFIIP